VYDSWEYKPEIAKRSKVFSHQKSKWFKCRQSGSFSSSALHHRTRLCIWIPCLKNPCVDHVRQCFGARVGRCLESKKICLLHSLVYTTDNFQQHPHQTPHCPLQRAWISVPGLCRLLGWTRGWVCHEHKRIVVSIGVALLAVLRFVRQPSSECVRACAFQFWFRALVWNCLV
jgi:hypothetical protein